MFSTILFNPQMSIKNMFPLKQLEITSLSRQNIGRNHLGRTKFLIKNKRKRNIYDDKV